MNTQVYFGISLSRRKFFDDEIKAVSRCLEAYGLGIHVFVDNHVYNDTQEKQMMADAFEEIQNSDFVIVELSHKAIGVGVEVGYARACNKRIVYLKKSEAAYSTTVGGCSDLIIEYDSEEELEHKLDQFMALNYSKKR